LEEKVIDKGSCEMMSISLVEMMRSSRQELQKQETAHKSLQKSSPCPQSLHWVPRPETSVQGQRALC